MNIGRSQSILEEQGILDPKRRKWEICLHLFQVVFSGDRMVSMSLDPGERKTDWVKFKNFLNLKFERKVLMFFFFLAKCV